VSANILQGGDSPGGKIIDKKVVSPGENLLTYLLPEIGTKCRIWRLVGNLIRTPGGGVAGVPIPASRGGQKNPSGDLSLEGGKQIPQETE